eukprot:3595946-Amphidinium_carterae.1
MADVQLATCFLGCMRLQGTIFDYYVEGSKLDEWTNQLIETHFMSVHSPKVNTLAYSSETPMGEITVPTGETVAMTYFMKAPLAMRLRLRVQLCTL